MRRIRILVGAAAGLITGATTGDVVGLVIVSDNLPFFIAFGSLVGICSGMVAALVIELYKQRETIP